MQGGARPRLQTFEQGLHGVRASYSRRRAPQRTRGPGCTCRWPRSSGSQSRGMPASTRASAQCCPSGRSAVEEDGGLLCCGLPSTLRATRGGLHTSSSPTCDSALDSWGLALHHLASAGQGAAHREVSTCSKWEVWRPMLKVTSASAAGAAVCAAAPATPLRSSLTGLQLPQGVALDDGAVPGSALGAGRDGQGFVGQRQAQLHGVPSRKHCWM